MTEFPAGLTREEKLAKLNFDTGRMTWEALARYFARGVVFHVDPALDLLDVALALAEDNADQVTAWRAAGQLDAPSDEHARAWQQSNTEFWAIVVAPFVIVQPVQE